MIERVTPDPTQDELAAIRAALSRRASSSAAHAARRTVDMHARDLEFDELRAAARARTRRP